MASITELHMEIEQTKNRLENDQNELAQQQCIMEEMSMRYSTQIEKITNLKQDWDSDELVGFGEAESFFRDKFLGQEAHMMLLQAQIAEQSMQLRYLEEAAYQVELMQGLENEAN